MAMPCGPFEKAPCEGQIPLRPHAQHPISSAWSKHALAQQSNLHQELQGMRRALVADFKVVITELERQQRELFQQQEAVLRTICTPPPDPLPAQKASLLSTEVSLAHWEAQDTQPGDPISPKTCANNNSLFFTNGTNGSPHPEVKANEYGLSLAPVAKKNSCEHNGDGSKKKVSTIIKKTNNMFGESSKADLSEEEYDVAMYYHDTGVCQEIARSETFSNITLFVIATNAVYLGVAADHNQAESLADTAWPFIIIDNLYCLYFAVEWLVRFIAFKNKVNCFKDAWFQFDTVLCITMVFETWIMALVELIRGTAGDRLPTGPIRMLRLLRLGRMVRLMRYFPEVLTMLKGVKKACRAMGSALLLLICLVYFFAMIMHMIMKEKPEVAPYYERLPSCMLTLLLDGTFLDGIGLRVREFLDMHSVIGFTIFMLFVLASALTVMNMLIGVLCEVVSRVAAKEKEDADIRIMKSSLLVLLKRLDADADGEISAEEFRALLADEDACRVLDELTVNLQFLGSWLEMLYETTHTVSVGQIMEIILSQRADRQTTFKDIVDIQYFTRWALARTLRGVLAEEIRGLRCS